MKLLEIAILTVFAISFPSMSLAQSEFGKIAKILLNQKETCEAEVGLFKAMDQRKDKSVVVANLYSKARAKYDSWIEQIKADIQDDKFRGMEPYYADLREAVSAVNDFKKAARIPSKGSKINLLDIDKAVSTLSDSMFKVVDIMLKEKKESRKCKLESLDAFKWRDYSNIPATKFE